MQALKNKTALGRGLGKLMKPQKAPPAKVPSNQEASIPTTQPEQLSAGMASLLRVTPEKESLEEKMAAPQAEPPTPPPKDLPVPLLRQTWLRLTLIGADLVLLALAARLILRAHERVGWAELLLCVVAVGMGAWLSCLALWREH